MPDCDLERWNKIALLIAEQTQKCVQLVVCASGQCQTIGEICPKGKATDG